MKWLIAVGIRKGEAVLLSYCFERLCSRGSGRKREVHVAGVAGEARFSFPDLPQFCSGAIVTCGARRSRREVGGGWVYGVGARRSADTPPLGFLFRDGACRL